MGFPELRPKVVSRALPELRKGSRISKLRTGSLCHAQMPSLENGEVSAREESDSRVLKKWELKESTGIQPVKPQVECGQGKCGFSRGVGKEPGPEDF